MSQSRILIAGTKSGCGKTTITMGIMAAMVNRGITVQPFKVGPDYIDPMFHTLITGRNSRNLDSWLLEETVLAGLFQAHADTAEISIIEGMMGLYDGYNGNSILGSTAHIAKITHAPVILAVDGEGLALSIAAVIQGFRDFDRTVPLGGVIINNINSEANYQLIREIITTHLGIPVLGYLPKNSEYALPSRHLGLVSSMEVAYLEDTIQKLAIQIEKTVDLDQILKMARRAEPLPQFDAWMIAGEKFSPRLPVAVAKDKAFNFYYADNLDLLAALGLQPVFLVRSRMKGCLRKSPGFISAEVIRKYLRRSWKQISPCAPR